MRLTKIDRDRRKQELRAEVLAGERRPVQRILRLAFEEDDQEGGRFDREGLGPITSCMTRGRMRKRSRRPGWSTTGIAPSWGSGHDR